MKRMAELERQLGGRDINAFENWNGKQQMMSRLIEEKLHVTAEIAGYKARLDNLNKDLSEGRTPPDIETTIRNTGTYNSFRMKVIDYDIDLQQVRNFMGEHANQVVAVREARDFWQKKVDQEHEDLKKTLSAGRKAEMESEIKASKANLGRIEESIAVSAKELGGLNQAMNEYTYLRRAEAVADWWRAGATFTKAVKVDGATSVTVAHAPTEQETRVVAVTSEGEEVAPSSQDVQSAGGVSQTTATFRGLAPKRIKSFSFQVHTAGRPDAAAPAPAKTAVAEPGPAPPAAVAAEEKNEALAMTLAEALEALSPGGELDTEVVRANQAQLDTTLRSLNEARELILQAQDERAKALQEAGGRKFTVEDFARVDPEMAAQMRARGEDQLRYDTELAQLGPKNPTSRNGSAVLQARIQRMQKYADELNEKSVIRWKPDGSGGALISKDLSIQEASVKRLEQLADHQTAEMAKIRHRRAQALILVEQFRAKQSAGTTTRPAVP